MEADRPWSEERFTSDPAVCHSRETRLPRSCAMRIEKTDRREQLWEKLCGVTRYGHTSKPLDDAA